MAGVSRNWSSLLKSMILGTPLSIALILCVGPFRHPPVEGFGCIDYGGVVLKVHEAAVVDGVVDKPVQELLAAPRHALQETVVLREVFPAVEGGYPLEGGTPPGDGDLREGVADDDVGYPVLVLEGGLILEHIHDGHPEKHHIVRCEVRKVVHKVDDLVLVLPVEREERAAVELVVALAPSGPGPLGLVPARDLADRRVVELEMHIEQYQGDEARYVVAVAVEAVEAPELDVRINQLPVGNRGCHSDWFY